MDKERREYFRVDALMIMHYEILTAEAMDQGIKDLHEGKVHKRSVRNQLLGLEVQLDGFLKQLGQEQPKAANALALINTKLNLMTESVEGVDSQKKALADEKLREVNVSASGLGLRTDEPLEVDTLLSLEMILYPSFDCILAYGEVVNSHPEGGHYRAGVHFRAILEDDKERLIQHVLKCQTEQLRAKRMARDKGVEIKGKY